MIEYYEQLLQEEQEAITEIIQTLFRQTFILEQKFDRRAGRLQYEKDYRVCTRHFEFLKHTLRYQEFSYVRMCTWELFISKAKRCGERNYRSWQQFIYYY